MDSKITLETVLNCVELFCDECTNLAAARGLDPEAVAILTQSELWTKAQRIEVERAFHDIVWASVDEVGEEQFAIPVDYASAVIAVAIKPCNIRIACKWFAGGYTADTIADTQESSIEPSTPAQMFAVVCLVYKNKKHNKVKEKWEKIVSKAIQQAQIGSAK